MMGAFTAYIKTITALTIFSAMAGLLMPEGNYRRYAELVLGVLILTAALNPFLRLFGIKAEEVSLSALRQGVRLERNYFSAEDCREMEKERLEHTYQALLEGELAQDLRKCFPQVEWVEAEFCKDAEEEEYGALRFVSVGCGGADAEEVQRYAAKRYGLPEESVLAVN